jgi:hypothetical protein
MTPVQLPVDYKPLLPEAMERESDIQFKSDLEVESILSLSELELLQT